MRKIRLEGDSELALFQEAYYERSGSRVELNYLKNASVNVFASETGKLVAGYVVNSQRPLRYLGALPKPVFAEIAAPILERENVGEIACIWIDSSRLSLIETFLVYEHSAQDSISLGLDYVLGGSVVESVRAFQMRLMPDLLYCGSLNTGKQSPELKERGWIYGTSSKALLWRHRLHTPIHLGLNRFRRKRKKAKSRVTSPYLCSSAERSTP